MNYNICSGAIRGQIPDFLTDELILPMVVKIANWKV